MKLFELPSTLHLPHHRCDDEDSKLPHHHYHTGRQWVPVVASTDRRSLTKLVIFGLALCIVFKLLVFDPILYAVSDVVSARFVNGKRCEEIERSHVEDDFYNPEDCYSRADVQQIILGLVWAIADTFERNGIPYWLDSGTLLGAYREETVIPHDFDADIGISEATYLKLRDTDLKLDFPSVYELHVFEAKYRKHGNRDAGIPSRLVHMKSGIYVDIFVFLESNPAVQDHRELMFGPIPSVCFGGCKRCPEVDLESWEFKIPKSWVYPLQPCWFGGRIVSCPAQPERYLEHLYGPNYMTPPKN